MADEEVSFWKTWKSYFVWIAIIVLFKFGYGYYNSNITEIFDTTNKLLIDYNQKLDAQNEFDTLIAGDKLASYVKEHRDVLDNQGSPKNWGTDILINISQNKVMMEENKKTEAVNKLLEEQHTKETGIFDNAKRLYDDYTWKIDLVREIQQRTDALGVNAGKSYYVEWIDRNNNAINSGERLASYLQENREVLDSGTVDNWASDTLVYIAKTKVTFERDNQMLNQAIN